MSFLSFSQNLIWSLDPSSETEDSSVGVMLAADTSAADVKRFEELLDEHATLCKKEPDEEGSILVFRAGVGNHFLCNWYR